MEKDKSIIDSIRRQAGIKDEPLPQTKPGDANSQKASDVNGSKHNKTGGANAKQLSTRQVLGIIILISFVYWAAESWLDRLFWLVSLPFGYGIWHGMNFLSLVAGLFWAALAAVICFAIALIIGWLRSGRC